MKSRTLTCLCPKRQSTYTDLKKQVFHVYVAPFVTSLCVHVVLVSCEFSRCLEDKLLSCIKISYTCCHCLWNWKYYDVVLYFSMYNKSRGIFLPRELKINYSGPVLAGIVQILGHAAKELIWIQMNSCNGWNAPSLYFRPVWYTSLHHPADVWLFFSPSKLL